jgi:hypothetical protein
VRNVDTLAPPVVRVRRPRASLWTLRTLLTLFLLAVLAQPVLAGMFLTGDVDAIGVHGLIGSLLALGALIVIGTALAYVLAGRGTFWVIPVSIGLFLAVGFQIGAGYARQLELHVPLGVLIVVTSVLFTAWSWTPWAARPRGAK